MYETVNRCRLLVTALLLAAAPISGAQAAALALVTPGDATLTNANITVEVGQLFTLELWALDFPANILDIPAVVEVSDANVVWDMGFQTPGPGIFVLEGSSLLADPATQPIAAGNFLIATWSFEALTTGSITLTALQDPYIFASPFTFLVDPTVIDPNLQTYQCLGDPTTQFCPQGGDFIGTVGSGIASVTVVAPSAVPVPPAVWLLGSALMGLIGVVRRKRIRA